MVDPLWIVWHPDGGEDGPDDGGYYRASSAENAAEQWAQRYDADDYPLRSDEDRRELVKVCPDGDHAAVHIFKVHASISVDYYAEEAADD